MSKSIKRNNKYFGYDDDDHSAVYDHKAHLREKRLRAALKSKNAQRLLDITEEDY